jgi:predicted type IV restriction endonuclease
MYDLGDTISNNKKQNLIIFMTFFASPKEDGLKKIKGFWTFDESIKTVKPYYVNEEKDFADEKFEPNEFKRSKVLLIEKDFNKILNKEVANKYISILLTHL